MRRFLLLVAFLGVVSNLNSQDQPKPADQPPGAAVTPQPAAATPQPAPPAPQAAPLAPQPAAAPKNDNTPTQPSSVNWNQRILVGVDISGASSIDPQQKIFADFYAEAPLGKGKVCDHDKSKEKRKKGEPCTYKSRDFFDSPFLVWFNPKIISVLKPSALPVGTVVSDFGNFNLGNTKLADLVQGIEFEGGGEFQWISGRDGVAIPGLLENTEVRTGLSLILGGGAATPLSTSNAIIFSQRNQTIDDRYPNIPALNTSAAGKTTQNPNGTPYDVIAFIPQERSRFYRDYFAGVRLKFYYYCQPSDKQVKNPSTDGGKACKDNANSVLPAFPGIFDITVGQNEFVTRGHLSGYVVKLDASFPLPINNVPIYVFGSVGMHAAANHSSEALVLTAPSSTKAITDPDVFPLSVTSLDNDVYTLGIGVDLAHITSIGKWIKDKVAQQQPAAGQGAAPSSTTTNPVPSAKPSTSAAPSTFSPETTTPKAF